MQLVLIALFWKHYVQLNQGNTFGQDMSDIKSSMLGSSVRSSTNLRVGRPGTGTVMSMSKPAGSKQRYTCNGQSVAKRAERVTSTR